MAPFLFMKVKMKIAMSGPEVSLKPGDIYEATPAEGKRLCEHGIAEPVKTVKKTTAKSKAKKETAKL